MNVRCFVDVDGHIWSINHKGESNFPGRIQINENDVWVLGENDGEGQAIEEEYVLWASLTELALVIEQSPDKSVD